MGRNDQAQPKAFEEQREYMCKSMQYTVCAPCDLGKNIQNFFTNKIVHSLINEKLLIRYKIVEKY